MPKSLIVMFLAGVITVFCKFNGISEESPLVLLLEVTMFLSFVVFIIVGFRAR
ncbi:MAG: hypothetical protein ACD_8C00025G0001 [uncultured bacterium]|nr:MAG: hypothetical protein ACD_8C00025G0001 [uncultured bacterium]